MLRSISKLFHERIVTQPSEAGESALRYRGNFAERLHVINSDPYLCIADEELKLISVFDDSKYDRADLDIVCGPMRLRALQKLRPLGFIQISGSVIENIGEDVRCIFPKFKAFGASPFDGTRDAKRRAQDYYILTPTQATCHIIDSYPLDKAVAVLEALVIKHPVNLLRVFDYLEANTEHQSFKQAIGHLVRMQRKAVAQAPLKTRHARR